jgi:thiol-disulfide isomerase/thioredoxin
VTDQPKYYDKRSDFWRHCFEQADDYETYLARSPEDKAQRWRDLADQLIPLTEIDIARLNGHNRRMNILVYSGVWCGDCVRQGPMIQQLAKASGPGVQLRVIDRDADEQLKDELRLAGAMRVPVVVFLTEDFWELGRFGDRMLTIYRKKAMRELGAACSVPYAVPPQEELAAERAEWLDVFERMLLMARLSPPLRERHGD